MITDGKLQVPSEIFEQVATAYKTMSEQAKYRPAAPSDGFGNIVGKLNLKTEVRDYAEEWWAMEEDGKYGAGCCEYEMRPAAIFTLEALRQLNSGVFGRNVARRLLLLALKEVETLP